MLAGSHAGFPTGLLPRPACRAGDAHPARDGARMPSVSSCLHHRPRGSGPCAPTLLFSQGQLVLGAFSGSIGRKAESFTCVTQCPHGRGRLASLCTTEKETKYRSCKLDILSGCPDFPGQFIPTEVLFDCSLAHPNFRGHWESSTPSNRAPRTRQYCTSQPVKVRVK